MKTLLSSGLIALGLFLYTNISYAESMLLDRTQLTLKNAPAVAELWGEMGSDSYAERLTIFVKQEDRVLAAYEPEIKGGYSCYLDTVRVKQDAPQENQLLYCIGSGDWQNPSTYGILDLSDLKHIKNLFTMQDNKGLLEAVVEKDKQLELTLKGKKPNLVDLPSDFNDDQPARRLSYAGYHTIFPYDVNGDGVQELFVCQKLQKNNKHLMKVGAILSLDKTEWRANAYTIMTAASSKQQDGVNNGLAYKNGVIIPRHLVLLKGEYSLPILLRKDNVDLHLKINDLIFAHCLPHMQGFINNTEDFAFKVKRLDEKLLSLQLVYGKDNIAYQCLTIDMQTGRKLELGDILDVKNKDLLPLLQLLRSNKNSDFTKELPKLWYIENDELYMLQQVNGQYIGSVFDLEVLKKYVVKRDLLKTD